MYLLKISVRFDKVSDSFGYLTIIRRSSGVRIGRQQIIEAHSGVYIQGPLVVANTRGLEVHRPHLC